MRFVFIYFFIYLKYKWKAIGRIFFPHGGRVQLLCVGLGCLVHFLDLRVASARTVPSPPAALRDPFRRHAPFISPNFHGNACILATVWMRGACFCFRYPFRAWVCLGRWLILTGGKRFQVELSGGGGVLATRFIAPMNGFAERSSNKRLWQLFFIAELSQGIRAFRRSDQLWGISWRICATEYRWGTVRHKACAFFFFGLDS